MSDYRKAHVGPVTLYATEIPERSSLVRVGQGDDLSYDRMITVTERHGGREIFLAGWIGPPLTVRQWRAAKATLFPDAVKVSWERREDDGSFRHVEFPV